MTAISVLSGDTTDTPKLSVTALSVVGCRMDRRVLKYNYYEALQTDATSRVSTIGYRSEKRIFFRQVEKRL